jgi:hypothetical protein
MTVVERTDILNKVADEITRRFDEFLEAECADTGKPKSLASHIDIPRGAANFKIFADVIKNAPTEFFEMATPDGKGAINYAMRRPVGVVGVVCPWNLPLLLMTWKVGPALACGNAVVVKPSEETPSTATLLGEVMNACGVPKGVYNVVHGFGPNSAGEFLTTNQGVNAITFTGETRTGAAIMKAAADGARPVSLEMGGKNPAIVFADCQSRRRHRGHDPFLLLQLRPGLPRHRARLCRAPVLRHLRRRPEGWCREAEARPSPAIRRPAWARWSARSTATRCSPTTARRSRRAPRWSPAAAFPKCRANWPTAPGCSRPSGPVLTRTPPWCARKSSALHDGDALRQ